MRTKEPRKDAALCFKPLCYNPRFTGRLCIIHYNAFNEAKKAFGGWNNGTTTDIYRWSRGEAVRGLK